MKVIAFVDQNKVLAELEPSDLAAMAGLSSAYHLGEKIGKNKMDYDKFNPNIVGTMVTLSRIYAEAKAILDTHKEALTAAAALKKASTQFLGWFDTSKEETRK